MKLLDDVLQLIREFSKPRFRYFREYKRPLRLLGLRSFPELEKILLENPERILPSFERLENADIV